MHAFTAQEGDYTGRTGLSRFRRLASRAPVDCRNQGSNSEKFHQNPDDFDETQWERHPKTPGITPAGPSGPWSQNNDCHG
jgi:hypothetical protein